ncbi:hypothetical protein [Cerasicoccus frondis]|uniref:hypothetical protein n=1 Tax=Cerasicoccus frondis TaxID=490090 RepID=UPI002852DB4C|nr:hypothetical protein [Cerasicoccus frondis]
MYFLLRMSSQLAGLAMLLAGTVAQAASINGTVQSGPSTDNTPIGGATVTLWEATSAAPVFRGSDVTDASGGFSIDSPIEQTNGSFYLTASVAPRVKFMTMLGPELPGSATINELTTVAGAYATAQLSEDGKVTGAALWLSIAAGMSDNLVDTLLGDTSAVMLAGPNADQTNSKRTLHSLANVIEACYDDPSVAQEFLQLATPEGFDAPSDTAEALMLLAQRPATNVAEIYALSLLGSAFQPVLNGTFESWVIAVKVNRTGSDDPQYFFGGPANVGFDSKGYAWIANNVVQGTGNSTDTVMVLKPNGMPSDGSNDRPSSPISGNGIRGVGWGVSVDSKDQVWYGNFGWGDTSIDTNYPTQAREGNGSVVTLTATGEFLSPEDAFFQGPLRVQAIEPDADDNIWIASLGNDSLFFFPNGDPYRSKAIYQYTNAGPFGIGVMPDGDVWMTNSGGIAGKYDGSVAKFTLDDDGDPEQVFLKKIGNTLKVVASDSYGNGWVASQGNSTVYVFDPDTETHREPIGAYTGIGGLDGPWGLCVDGDDNIWIGNFGALFPGRFTGRLTQLAGANPDTRPPGLEMGDAMSPNAGFRVESAGEPVTLPDDTPLFPNGDEDSFKPQMRSTSVQIDRAGNLWTFNNWKPPFLNDVTNNPGGDGILIFLGLAPPPSKYEGELTKDSDGDGLTDEFENQVINYSDTDAYVTYADVTPGGDFDEDGLIESDEQATSASPTAQDTDGDLFTDKDEVDFGSDPTDPESLPIEQEILAAVEYRFSTEVGYLYQVQYSDDLVVWEDLGSPVVGNGETQSVFISLEGRDKNSENYRLIVSLAE